MAKKSKKNQKTKPIEKKEEEKDKGELTWQQIAEARKPVAQKAIELLDDPTKHLIRPKEEVSIHKELKIKTQPDPTHTIITEISPLRPIINPLESHSPKKALKSEIIYQETRTLTPEEIANLKKGMQNKPIENQEDIEDDLFKSIGEAAKKLMKVFKKKKPGVE